MAPPKVEIWQSFQYFNHADLDYTFKRGPGVYFDQVKAERTSRKRPESEPPPKSSPLDATWSFHHTQDHTDYHSKGPKLYNRPAAATTHDKLTATLACDLFRCHGFEERPITKRRPGQFSPSTGATFGPRSKSLGARDFHARGVLDIDSNMKRSGLGKHDKVTFDLEQHFSEETGFQLKQSVATLTETKLPPELPDYVQDMMCLGIEHRRLAIQAQAMKEIQEKEGPPRSSPRTSPRYATPRLERLSENHLALSSGWQDPMVASSSREERPLMSPTLKTREMRQPSRSPQRCPTRSPRRCREPSPSGSSPWAIRKVDEVPLSSRSSLTARSHYSSASTRAPSSSPPPKVKSQHNGNLNIPAWKSEVHRRGANGLNVNLRRWAQASGLAARGSLPRRIPKQEQTDELTRSVKSLVENLAASSCTLASARDKCRIQEKTTRSVDKDMCSEDARHWGVSHLSHLRGFSQRLDDSECSTADPDATSVHMRSVSDARSSVS